MSVAKMVFQTLIRTDSGTTVTRKPFPTGALVTGIKSLWMEDAVNRVVNAEGERTVRFGTLQVVDDASYLESDHWVIGGEEWNQQHLHSVDGGVRTMYLRRDDKLTTKQSVRNRVA